MALDLSQVQILAGSGWPEWRPRCKSATDLDADDLLFCAKVELSAGPGDLGAFRLYILPTNLGRLFFREGRPRIFRCVEDVPSVPYVVYFLVASSLTSYAWPSAPTWSGFIAQIAQIAAVLTTFFVSICFDAAAFVVSVWQKSELLWVRGFCWTWHIRNG
jgi:hypothetical protein